MKKTMAVSIVGAGICGLATAVACKRAGAKVVVFEAAPKLLPLGTAISVWPNALGCLSSWDLANDVAAVGHPFKRVVTRQLDGSPIFDFDLADLHQKHGEVSRCVTRADLHALLAAQLSPDELRLNTPVDAVRPTDCDATLTLADQSEVVADLVVVADGARSRLRAQVIGEDAMRPAGYGAVLGLAPTWSTPIGWGETPEACEYYGPNGRFGVFRTGAAQTYWFFVSSDIAQTPSAVQADPAWVMAQLRDWPAFMRDLVAATPADQMPQVAFYDRAPAKHWGNGRVLVAGDAAHPMLPNFGQGANQAIEDAYAIGLAIARGHEGAALARAYANMRKAKADSIVKQSRQNGQLTQVTHPVAQKVRNAIMRAMPRGIVAAQLDRQFTLPRIG